MAKRRHYTEFEISQLDNEQQQFVARFLNKTDLTQEQLAKILNKKPASINRWINGKTTPSNDVMFMLKITDEMYDFRRTHHGNEAGEEFLAHAVSEGIAALLFGLVGEERFKQNEC